MNEPVQSPTGEQSPKQPAVSPWLMTTFIIILVVGGGYLGWNFWNKSQIAKQSTSSTPVVVKTPSPDQKDKSNNSPTNIFGTDNGKTYTDSLVGFTFEHPGIEVETDLVSKTKGTFLTVEAQKINEIGDLPSAWGTKEAIEDKAALESGLTTVRTGWTVTESIKLLKIDGAVGKTQFYGASFDTSADNIALMAIIYKGEYRIVISLSYNDNTELVKNNPQYFEVSKSSNDSFYYWKDGQIGQFYMDLVNKKTDSITQNWYNQFNQIISTFKVIN